MNQELTTKEINRIQDICFDNPARACAVAQIIIDTCQVVSCADFAQIKGKSKRTINYKAHNLTGLRIKNRYFISINQ